MMRSDMKKEMQSRGRRTNPGEGGNAGTVSRPGPVAKKPAAEMKASPRKKMAMGAKY